MRAPPLPDFASLSDKLARLARMATDIGCGNRRRRGRLCRVEERTALESYGHRLTERLRLEPIGPANAADLWLVHNDDQVAYWYDNEKPTLAEAEEQAESIGESWRLHGVHKWIAYDRSSGEVVGRGGLSR